nr:poly(ADP-ribose) glycohydrolase [Ciona intestinalis]|eukprot:XP_002124980.3 poly(ADP-ribose) glycohydrolase [Ciona intestinalis]
MLQREISPPKQKLKQASISEFFSLSSKSVKRKRSPTQSENEVSPFAKKTTEHKTSAKTPVLDIGVKPTPTKVSQTKSPTVGPSHEKMSANSEPNSSRLLSGLTEAEGAEKNIIQMSKDATNFDIDSILENVTENMSHNKNNSQSSKPDLESMDVTVRAESPLLFEDSIQEAPVVEPESMQFTDGPTCMGMPAKDLKRIPNCWATNPFTMESGTRHLKLYNTSHKGPGPPPPKSTTYYDAWDSHHVRLPCSTENLYPVTERGRKSLEKRWELIRSSLLMKMDNEYDLQEAILTYNSRYCKKWSFQKLGNFFTQASDSYKKKFFGTTLPRMVALALDLPNICTQPIPLLCHQRSCKVTMTQQQIACLLCNAFFCTFPRRNSKGPNSEYSNYPSINFSSLFNGAGGWHNSPFVEKFKTILHYFERVCENMPTGTVTFERRCLSDFPRWEKSPCTLGGLHLSNEGRIECDGIGLLQVDFANRYLGGGVLSSGLVQEEILFSICPELIVSKLFVEKLDDNECVVITGAEQFSSYTGYADTYKWGGNHIDTTTRDDFGRLCKQLVAMDATCYQKSSNQFKTASVRRELNKAFCGFYCDMDPEHSPAVATGNWGCGAFGGNPLFKGLLQLMAAATVGRDLCYFTFNDRELMQQLHEMHSFIKENKMRVSDLWNIIICYNKQVIESKDSKSSSIFKFIRDTHILSTDED